MRKYTEVAGNSSPSRLRLFTAWIADKTSRLYASVWNMCNRNLSLWRHESWFLLPAQRYASAVFAVVMCLSVSVCHKPVLDQNGFGRDFRNEIMVYPKQGYQLLLELCSKLWTWSTHVNTITKCYQQSTNDRDGLFIVVIVHFRVPRDGRDRHISALRGYLCVRYSWDLYRVKAE